MLHSLKNNRTNRHAADYFRKDLHRFSYATCDGLGVAEGDFRVGQVSVLLDLVGVMAKRGLLTQYGKVVAPVVRLVMGFRCAAASMATSGERTCSVVLESITALLCGGVIGSVVEEVVGALQRTGLVVVA